VWHEKATGGEESYRLTAAPRFQLRRGFSGRIDRTDGVERDGGSFYPRDAWQALSAEELSSLVTQASGPGAVLPATELGLLQIPERIRAAWWSEAEKGSVSEGFQRVFTALIEFFRFKRLPFPERVHLEVAVNAPGSASTRAGTGGIREGLAYCDRPGAEQGRAKQTLGLVNLGDEAAFVVLLDLPPSRLVAGLEVAGESGASALTPERLVCRYFEVFPRQPLLRVRLEPGEGLWLSPRGVVHDGWTRGKRDLDVVLSLRMEVADESHREVEGSRPGGAAGPSEAEIGK